ncbi:MAG: ABC transporter permease [Desulfovibrio sp.]|uniref:ABC transporter permease n=1 Tax=Desulfovibrio sp. 7SRBS1 TaxID=3378064 RepID=UPI003B4039FC
MLLRLRRLLVKEFLQLLRDPKMRIIIFVAPVLQLTVFAFALTTDVDNVETILMDRDHTPQSRELLSRFTGSHYFKVIEVAQGPEDVNHAMNTGEARAAIVILPGFAKDIISGGTAAVQVITDGTDSNSAALVNGYAMQIVQNFNAEVLARRMDRAGLRPPGAPVSNVSIAPRAWFNPNMESKYFYVPGLTAVMLVVVTLLLTSIAIVREKEIGTIEQIMVTPIRGSEFILGKCLPFIIIGYILMTVMLFLSMIIFDIQVRGSWLTLYVLSGVFLAGNTGLALIISVSARTQQQALLTAFFFLMPSILLSGFMFPVANMPVPVQYATYLNPLRWYMEILRGVLIKGVGFQDLVRPVIGQCLLAVAFIALAAMNFRKNLE